MAPPNRITLRLDADADILIIEADGQRVDRREFPAQEGDALVIAAGMALRAAGWREGENRMYADTGLVVLHFDRPADGA